VRDPRQPRRRGARWPRIGVDGNEWRFGSGVLGHGWLGKS
jgi:hypothetical protein